MRRNSRNVDAVMAPKRKSRSAEAHESRKSQRVQNVAKDLGNAAEPPAEPELTKTLNELAASAFAEKYLPADDPVVRFSSRETHVSITLQSSRLSAEDVQTCFQLIETTSSAAYKASSIGWNPPEKMEELLDSRMRFLLVRRASASSASSGPPVHEILGFLSFMITNDDPPHQARPVVYIYEVHLCEALRGVGLGSHLITMAESVAKRAGISKSMLTVFTANKGARRLYERLGYQRDQASLPDRSIRGRTIEPDHIIMGKELGQSGVGLTEDDT